MSNRPISGILLTGGSSTRMGRDKATMRIGGSSLAQRSAHLLSGSVDIAIEVGDGVSGLFAVREEPSGEGPLAAIVAGHRALMRLGVDPGVSCLVLACDLPLLDAWVLDRLAAWPGDRSVLPIIDHFAQPLCARWASRDLERARVAFATNERSLSSLPDRSLAVLVDEEVWGEHRIAFSDVDDPDDLVRLGLVSDDQHPPRHQ